MKTISVLTLALSTFTLLACAEVEPTQSDFVTLAADGSMDTGLDVRLDSGDSDFSGNGYTIEIGGEAGFTSAGFRASAGMFPGSSVGDLPSTGTAVLSGTYEVVYGNSITASALGTKGLFGYSSANIDLTADFTNGTLIGQTSRLVVSGLFSGSVLDGFVTFDGTAGTLDGLIGGDNAIGIFHGHSDTEIFAGGFLVD